MKAGVIAAAELYVADVRPELQKGYTSGAFTTGNAANSVERGDPEASSDGVSIKVGSTQIEPPYPLYWELGHLNLFTGKQERFEVWVPTMIANMDRYIAACAAEIKAVDGQL